MDNLYLEHIITLSKEKKYLGKNDGLLYKAENIVCGDSLFLYIESDKDGNITKINFEGDSCALSRASTNVFCEYIFDMNIKNIKKIKPNKIYSLFNISKNPARSECILLPLKAITSKSSI